MAEEHDLAEDELVGVSTNGTGILLARHGGTIHAILDRCSHRGCSLSEGSLDDGVVTCPCHGSRFELDGTLVKGPATAPQPALDVRVRNGRVEVRGREA